MLRTLFVSVALAGALGAQSNVIVVDGTGAGDALSIGAGVALANDGDTLLVRSGDYEAFTIDGKSLFVVEDAGASVRVNSGVEVLNLAVDQAVVLRGLDIDRDPGTFLTVPALEITDCSGTVLVEDSRIELGVRTFTFKVPSAIEVTRSERVSITSASVLGGTQNEGLLLTFPGSESALSVEDSTVSLYDVHAVGGQGVAIDGFAPQPGAEGVTMRAGLLHVVSSSIRGGHGADETFINSPFGGMMCAAAGDGGDGLVMLHPRGVVTLRGATIQGGDRGDGAQCSGGALDGTPIQQQTGTLTDVAGPTDVSLSVDSPARDHTSASVSVKAPPSSTIFLLVSAGIDAQFSAGLGLVTPAAPFQFFTLAVMPPSGVFIFGAPLGVLPPGVDALTIETQLALAPPGAPACLHGHATLTILDPSF